MPHSRNPLMPFDAWLMAKGQFRCQNHGHSVASAGSLSSTGSCKNNGPLFVCASVCLVQIYLYLEHVRGTCNANEAHFNLDLWPEIGTVHCLSNLSLSFSLSFCLSLSLSLSPSVYLSISFPFSLCIFYFIFCVPYEMRQGTEQQDWTSKTPWEWVWRWV